MLVLAPAPVQLLPPPQGWERRFDARAYYPSQVHEATTCEGPRPANYMCSQLQPAQQQAPQLLQPTTMSTSMAARTGTSDFHSELVRVPLAQLEMRTATPEPTQACIGAAVEVETQATAAAGKATRTSNSGC